MTLLITECSEAGVVMVADSTISTVNSKGQIVEVDQQRWTKVLRVPRARAIVGYWGFIGRIYRGRFDEWLSKQLSTATFSDLPSLAQSLADILNATCGGKPLNVDECVGIHVAGFHPWTDGKERPFFLHVHNGPGYMQIQHVTEPLPGGERLIEVRPRFVGGPRKLFESHPDFPSPSLSLEENLETLRRVHITRNGDFFYYSIVWDALQRSFNYLNLISGFSIPRDPTSLGARRGLMVAALETMIRVYACSNKPRIVGGTARAEAIGPHGYLN